MMNMRRVAGLFVVFSVLIVRDGAAQSPDQQAANSQPPPPPATKLEGFKPAAGSVVTLGYDELGNVAGVSVDVREVRDLKSPGARGLLVDITESQYRRERAFVGRR